MMRSYRVDTAAGWWPDCGFRRLSELVPEKTGCPERTCGSGNEPQKDSRQTTCERCLWTLSGAQIGDPPSASSKSVPGRLPFAARFSLRYTVN